MSRKEAQPASQRLEEEWDHSKNLYNSPLTLLKSDARRWIDTAGDATSDSLRLPTVH